MMQHIFVGTSILLPLIVSDLGLNYTEFGVAIAVSTLIGGLSQMLFGICSRKIARHVLLGFGNVLLSAGTFVTGLAHSLIDFLGARTIANVGVAPQHPMGTAIVSERFEGKSVGRAIGIHYGLAYVGNIIGPLTMTFLVVVLGWRNTLFAFAVPTLIVGLIVIWYLNEGGAQESTNGEALSLKSDVMMLLKTRSVIPVVLAQALLSGGTDLGIITTYTPLFLADALKLDVYSYTYGITYTIGLVGGVVGPVLLGRHADRKGHLRTAAVSSFFAVILVYLLSVYESANLILPAHLFLLGLTSFALPTLLQSHLVTLTRSYSRDLVIGLFFTVVYVFSSLWSGVIGYMVDTYSSFTPAFYLMGTLGLMAFLTLAYQLRKPET